MTIAFAPNLSVEVVKYLPFINSLKSEIAAVVEGKNYGDEISELYIGIVSVSPQFAQFFKPRKPKYTKGSKLDSKGGAKGSPNMFEYDVRIDHKILSSASDPQAKRIIAQGILSSFDVFEKFEKFDAFQLKSDLENLFHVKGWS